ncbi:hypothetical protein [Streptomyces sp. NPDC001815]|uniref:hypothetical protein n=1 Tax=Streptomyces sp. NPDC001815 TaxID=3154526 RepID=UPI003326391F
MSKKEEEFNPWKWDRKNAMAGRSRLVVERHGHEVTLDRKGVSIDGERVVRDNPGQGEHGFEVTPAGLVMYRGREVAAIAPSPEGTANPGEVTVWDADSPKDKEREKAAREKEEAERKSRDDRYRGGQQHDQNAVTLSGQEMTL